MPSFTYDPGKGIVSSAGGGFTIDGTISDSVVTHTIGSGETATLANSGVDSITTTAATGTVTLPNGSRIGDQKFIVLADHGGNLTLSVTTHSSSSPEVFTGNGTGDSLLLCWSGTKWHTVVNGGFAT